MIVAHIHRLDGSEEYFGPFSDEDSAERWIRVHFVFTKWESAQPRKLDIQEPYE